MAKGIQKVRGTQDMIGEEADRFHRVVEAFDRVRRLYAFQHIEVPVFEATEVFARTLGETTDVVSKEMYTFEDRGGESLTLRPEFTAGICRAFISDGWQQYTPLKVATWGAAFRYERPQKGRFRQFHQLDAEILGAAEPAADVELIAMAAQLLAELGIAERVELKLNTLGDPATREAWRQPWSSISEPARSISPMKAATGSRRTRCRILDSKQHQDFPVVDSAPVIDDFLTPEAADIFAAVTAGLDAIGVKWTRDPRLVRGLDYYRHTTFEFVTEDLGAQSQVIGGGRYDGLIETMGGPTTPAVGWAAGIERLGDAARRARPRGIDAAIVPLGEAAEARATALAAELRAAGLVTDMAFRGNMKRRMQKASASGARFAIILGDDELAKGEAAVKDLVTGSQTQRLAGRARPGAARVMTRISAERIAAIEARREELQAAMSRRRSRAGAVRQALQGLCRDRAGRRRGERGAAAARRNRFAGGDGARAATRNCARWPPRSCRINQAKLAEAERGLALRLLPRDAADERAAMLEIRAGTGGDEAALFAGDLLRMYQRYAEAKGWRFELISASPSEIGGYKEAIASVTGQGVFARLKFESGVAPRPARPGDRERRPHPHVGGHRRGAARGGGGRRPDRRQGPPHRHLPLLRPRRPVGQHHRQRGAHHPYPDRARRHPAGREVAAQEQGQGAEGPAHPPLRTGARAAPRRTRGGEQVDGRLGRPFGADPHL